MWHPQRPEGVKLSYPWVLVFQAEARVMVSMDIWTEGYIVTIGLAGYGLQARIVASQWNVLRLSIADLRFARGHRRFCM